MNTYSHVIEQLQDGAAQEMSALLWTERRRERPPMSIRVGVS